MSKPWEYEYETQNEDGEPEHWVLKFKRPTRRSVIAVNEMFAETGIEQVRMLGDLCESIFRPFVCNGQVMDFDEVPMSILTEALHKHDTFRLGQAGE